MDRVDVKCMKNMLLYGADVIIQSEPYLTEVDSVIGDGDHGTGMKRGFTALKQAFENQEFQDIDTLCRQTGIELLKSMGGASGVIFGTMFIGGADVLPHGESATLVQLAEYFNRGEKAIEKRGKTVPGQKTMLDALAPACQALLKAADQGKSIEEAFDDAAQAAVKGVEDTKSLQGRVGRSKNFREAAVGLPDPGAISVSLLFKAYSEALKKR